MAQDDAFSNLQKDYENTRIISVVQRNLGPPQVQWDNSLSESEVVAGLLKALLHLVIDEYVADVFDEWAEDNVDWEDPDDDEELTQGE